MLLLALVTHLDFKMFKMGVKTTFLNGNLEEEVIRTNLLVMHQRDKRTMCVILKGPYMILSNLSDLGTLDSMKP